MGAVFERCGPAPLLQPDDVPPVVPGDEVIGVFNPAAIRREEVLLLLFRSAERPRSSAGLLRVPVYEKSAPTPEGGGGIARQVRMFRLDDGRYDFSDPRVVVERDSRRIVALTSFSFLRRAVLRPDGQVEVDPRPILWPSDPAEAWGMEDPRIVAVEGRLVLSYAAVSARGIVVMLAASRDGRTFERLGVALPPENKNAVLFPRRLGGRYVLLHRPVPAGIGTPDVWYAASPDLRHWGDHRPVFGVRPGAWDEARVGAGAPPIETEKGWLLFYHGADRHNRYAMGAVLLHRDRPWEVLARTAAPLLEPEAPYERRGFFGGVVFPTGAVLDEDGTVTVFYGAADEAIGCARAPLQAVLEALWTSNK
ncbi:MAG: glycoside hydrolase family 130 protein [Hydrogenibacillus schlegelii]|nr:glycoside hydrolase family 130 protein [Hydrogenibacillus schlegelii]